MNANDRAPATGLFDNEGVFEPIALPDAELRLMQGFYRPPYSDALMRGLRDELSWTQETIQIAGVPRLQPRLSAWYGDQGKAYTYSGITLAPRAWTPVLWRIKCDVEAACGHRFNSVLANLYRNERDGVGWHSDSERELGPAPVIASLSLGATRVFSFRHKKRKDLGTLCLPLQDGALLLMAGTTQRWWRHAIEKESAPCGPRINLTFRDVLTA